MIQIFDSMTELLESVPKENMTFEMCNAFVKATFPRCFRPTVMKSFQPI